MSSRSESEKRFEARLVSEIINLGGRCIKLEVKGQRGWPDRLCILPGGVTVFVEMKRPDGKGYLSRQQRMRIEELVALGHRAVTINSEAQLELFIEALALEVLAEKERRKRMARWTYDSDSRDGSPV